MNLGSTIQDIVDYVVHVTEPDEVILFGSMARRITDCHSDIDLLVVVRDTIDAKEAVSRIRNHARQLALRADIIILTRPQFDREIDTPNAFVRGIRQSGKIVYKRA